MTLHPEDVGDAGCLPTVKDYTGDRLDFGLPDAPRPRGVTGTRLAHKIAGAMAAAGAPLADVAAAAREVARAARTIGMSLTTFTLPGAAPEERIAPGGAELGLGLHGEPAAMMTAREDWVRPGGAGADARC